MDRLPQSATARRAQLVSRVVATSATLSERIARSVVGPPSEPERLVADLEARWADRVADGDRERFETRLRWDGLSRTDLRLAQGIGPPAQGESLSRWAVLLSLGLARVSELPGGTVGDGQPVARRIVRPFVDAAAREMESRCGPALALFDAAARKDLEGILVTELSAGVEATVAVEFAAWSARRRGDPAGPGGDVAAFERHLLSGGGLNEVLERFPVLGRVMGQRMLNWIDATAELARRLLADWSLLEDRFACNDTLGPVHSVDTMSSDPHCGGRRVHTLTFASGVRVVYKPRSLAVAAAFQDVLAWVNRRNEGPALRTIVVVDRALYGWAEHVSAGPCSTRAQLDDFYWRAGALLCLSYLLGGSDHHASNVLAVGDDPVLIDLETLVGGPLKPLTPRAEHNVAVMRAWWNSVLRTHLLPRWVVTAEGPRLRGGLLGGSDAVFAGAIAEGDSTLGRRGTGNVPVLGGAAQSAGMHADAVIRGFEAAYRTVRAGRGDFLRVGGPLERFRHCVTRVVIRDTRLYARLLKRMRHPRFLTDGITWSLEIESLCRRLLQSNRRPLGWDVFASELRDLSCLDVPRFAVATLGGQVRDSRGRAVGHLQYRSGMLDVTVRIRAMCEEDLSHQTSLVRLTLAGPSSEPPSAKEVPSSKGESDRPLLTEACATADRIIDHMVEERDGVTWLVAGELRQSGKWGFAGADWSLSGGVPGICLFLCMCARESGCTDYAEVALSALRPLLDAPRGTPCAPELSLGGHTGVGGLVYALAAAGRILDDARLLDVACSLISGVPPGRVRDHGASDIANGISGLLLAALAVYEATRSPAAFALAEECGTTLLRRRSWEGIRWPGLSHGTAGVAHALVCLARRNGDRRTLDAGRLAFAADETRRNGAGRWRGTSARSSWTPADVGATAARVAATDVLGPPCTNGHLKWLDARPEIPTTDDLQNGSLGLVDGLLGMSRATDADAPRARAAARDVAYAAIARRRHRGTFSLGIDDVFAPGLLTGLAGVGYELLRVRSPGRVASVLLWE